MMDDKCPSGGWTILTLKEHFEVKISALRNEFQAYKEATNKALELKSAQGTDSSGHTMAIVAAVIAGVAAVGSVVAVFLHR